MSDSPRMTDMEIREGIRSLPGWRHDGEKLVRVYRFRDFSEAFGFMARAALAAEKLEHYPDWSNFRSTVTVHLTTHDAGGVTELDFELARHLEGLAATTPES